MIQQPNGQQVGLQPVNQQLQPLQTGQQVVNQPGLPIVSSSSLLPTMPARPATGAKIHINPKFRNKQGNMNACNYLAKTTHIGLKL